MKHNTAYQIRSDYSSICIDTDNELIIELDSACNRPTMNFATLHDAQSAFLGLADNFEKWSASNFKIIAVNQQ